VAKKRQAYTEASIFASPNTSRLADVNVGATDRLWFYDASAGTWQFLTVGSGLSISGTTLTGVGAPSTAEYIVAALDGGLSGERLATNTNSVVWDFATASAAKASVRWAVSAKTADYTVLTTDTNTLFTNSGSVGTVVFDLPDSTTCVAGQTTFAFGVVASEIITIDFVNASDVLYGYAGGLSFMASQAAPLSTNGIGQGDICIVLCLGANEWMAMNCNGTWAV